MSRNKRCGATKPHMPHWHASGKSWCDGKTGSTQHDGA